MLHRGYTLREVSYLFVEFEPSPLVSTRSLNITTKVTDSDAYIFCIRMFTCSISGLRRRSPGMTLVLDPSQKLPYLGKHWSAELQAEVLVTVEKIVSNIYPESLWFKHRWLRVREAPVDQ